MKLRQWLSVLVPPALLAAVLAWQVLIAGGLDFYLDWYTGSSQGWAIAAGVGLIAGLAVPLCTLAQGGGLRVNGGALTAGAVMLSLSAAAVALGAGLTDDDLGWVFTDMSLAVPAFGGVLVSGSLAFGGVGGSGFSFRWKQAAWLLLAGLAAYASGAVMNAFHHFMPHTFSFDNFPPHPGPDFLAMRMVRFGHVMMLLALAPLLIPASLPTGGVKTVMKVYGVLFSAASLVLTAGYAVWMLKAIAIAPHFGAIPNSPVSEPFLWMLQFSTAMMDAVFVMAGVCLRLGFGRAVRPIPARPGSADPV